jgi:hypothetical protein
MESEVIDRLRGFLRATGGKMMHVEFIKRKTGELRIMPRCRVGVKKHKVDPSSPPDPILIAQDQKHALLRVFDMDAIDKKTGRKGAYRMIVLDGLKKIRAGGEEFTV